MESASRYQVAIRTQVRPRVGYTYVITDTERPGWLEKAIETYGSHDAALKASQVALRRLYFQPKKRRA
jgi:hypothetical protein